MSTFNILRLDHLLTSDMEHFISEVASMSADDCEQYARAILDQIGGPTFDQYLMRIVDTMIPDDGSGPPRNSDDYYFAVRDMFPHISTEDDILGRLAGLVMRMAGLRMVGYAPRLSGNDKTPGR